MDIWQSLREIGRILLWGLVKAWEALNWLYVTTEPSLGTAGALMLTFFVVFFPVLIVVLHSIAKTEAGLETFGASFLGTALKVFAVFIVTVVILFILKGG